MTEAAVLPDERVELSWRQKLAAMRSLADPTVQMINDGGFCCSLSSIEVKNGGILSSVCGFGKTPEAAINACWRTVTDIPDHHIVVAHAMDPAKRRHYRWQGFMWRELPK